MSTITARNYAAQAERSLEKCSKSLFFSGEKQGAIAIAGMQALIKNAVKFALPDGGAILKDGGKGITKRLKHGKLPIIYETKILTIKPSVRSSSAEKGGSHTSPRQHLRRGHIRRLDSGNIWVNSCVVGSAEKGRIDKSYRVAD